MLLTRVVPHGSFSSQLLEDELVRIRDIVSLKETEESWDTIAKGIGLLKARVQRDASLKPDETLHTLRSTAHSVNAAVLSDRSRLSAAAIELLSTAAAELGSSFDPLVSIFFPTLLTLCSRTNKVFVSRARACLITIIESTQSPLILSYLCRSMKDKSMTLRLTAAECALICLNSFNPPDLQKEARSREVELLIKCAATDANADIRKYGRKMYDAYKVLLPERVDSFTAPLTPTIRKYLNVVHKQKSHHPQSNPSSRSSSRPTSSLSMRSAVDSGGSDVLSSSSHSDSRVNRAYDKPTIALSSSVPSRAADSHPQSMHPALAQSFPSRRPPSRAQPATGDSANLASREKRNMPPPDFVPPRPHLSAASLNAKAPQRPVSTKDVAETSTLPPQRQRVGPLRPSQFQTFGRPRPEASQAVAEQIGTKRSAGARRVPLQELPAAKEKAQDDSRKASSAVRPQSSCDGRAPLSQKSNASHPAGQATSQLQDKAKAVTTKAGTHAATHHPVPSSTSADQQTELRTKKMGAGNDTHRVLQHRPNTRPAQMTVRSVEIQQAGPSRMQAMSGKRPVVRGNGKKQRHVHANNATSDAAEIPPAALIPLPPSPTSETAPVGTDEVDVVKELSNAQGGLEETLPSPLLNLAVDAVTPKAVSSGVSSIVEQTPISALVESIRRGFVPMEGAFDEEDEEECERTFIAGESQYITTLPKWGPLFTKSRSVGSQHTS
ncbi:hypothetical protein NM688_g2782 [Phlebia brevispora]|uniref:Uncharacterized protein n=1 Tax=Phlebia brevispora TaxID=194682 RepID=A0ACC1T7L4_9APHY|nr:hypothetical protein NM688_g2782 [Phlebia brevispora]